MKIKAYKRFQRAYQDLPKNVQTKVDKQITLLDRIEEIEDELERITLEL